MPVGRKQKSHIIKCAELISHYDGALLFGKLLLCFLAFAGLPPRPLQRALAQARKTKHVLSAIRKSDFVIEGLHDNKDFSSSFTREDVEGES